MKRLLRQMLLGTAMVLFLRVVAVPQWLRNEVDGRSLCERYPTGERFTLRYESKSFVTVSCNILNEVEEWLGGSLAMAQTAIAVNDATPTPEEDPTPPICKASYRCRVPTQGIRPAGRASVSASAREDWGLGTFEAWCPIDDGVGRPRCTYGVAGSLSSMKDYLTVKEAAEYCCVSPSQFWAKIQETGLRPGKLWAKNIYRKSDLQAIIEREAWQPSNGESTGLQTAPSRGQLRSIGSRRAYDAANSLDQFSTEEAKTAVTVKKSGAAPARSYSRYRRCSRICRKSNWTGGLGNIRTSSTGWSSWSRTICCRPSAISRSTRSRPCRSRSTSGIACRKSPRKR